MEAPSIYTTPALPPPPGYVIDFENPQRRGLPLAYWVIGVGLVLATFSLALRIYTKVWIVRDFKAEDWCIVSSYVLSVAVQAITIRSFVTKAGAVHAWEQPIVMFNYELALVTSAAVWKASRKFCIASQEQRVLAVYVMGQSVLVLYAPCLGLAKISLLVFYFRMSQSRWLRISSAAIGIFIFAYTLTIILTTIFPCSPIQKAWDITISHGSCINRSAVYIIQAVTNIATDIALLILPIPMVWKLRMPIIQKVGVLIVFIIGSLTCITSVIRLILLLPALHDPDHPWAIAIPSMWTAIESNLVIISCALPTLRLLLRHVAPKLMGQLSLARTNNKEYGTSDGPSTLKKSRTHSGHGKMNYSASDPTMDLDSYPSKSWRESGQQPNEALNSHPEESAPFESDHLDTHEQEEQSIDTMIRKESFIIPPDSRYV